MYRNTFKAFYEQTLSEYFEANDVRIQSKIEKESENYILNVNETEYLNHLIDKFSIEKLTINFNGVFITNYEKDIPAEDFPDAFFVLPGKSYPRHVVVYHLPYTGNKDLLEFRPSHFIIGWYPDVFIENQNVCFEIMSFNEVPLEIKGKAQEIIKFLSSQLEYLNRDIDEYNSNLIGKIKQFFKSRKKRLLDKNKMLSSLGVPIKKKADLPETYSIPISPSRKLIIKKPEVTESGFEPEPTIDKYIYHEILKTIHNLGKVFERLPSTYRSKREEELRDHILLYLEPRFEGSATGETFNKRGSTDILIRHENSNVFIAECKFWRGQKHYLNSISQLLKYLTWRDSKVAVVLFVKNEDFTSVLKIIEEVTPNHSNYLGFVDKEDETWFNYRFHIIDDRNREVKLAVLAFHLPAG